MYDALDILDGNVELDSSHAGGEFRAIFLDDGDSPEVNG